MSPFLSPLQRDWIPRFPKKELPLQGNVAHLIHWTLFCCRPTGPGDQAVQDGGGLLVFWAQGTEGQHGEGFTHHGCKERWGQSRPTRSAAKRGFSSRGGRKITKLSRSSASPLCFLLLLLPSCACSFLPSSTNPLLVGFASHPHVILLLLSPSSRPLSLRKSGPHHQPLPHPPQRGKKSWWKLDDDILLWLMSELKRKLQWHKVSLMGVKGFKTVMICEFEEINYWAHTWCVNVTHLEKYCVWLTISDEICWYFNFRSEEDSVRLQGHIRQTKWRSCRSALPQKQHYPIGLQSL